MDNKEVINFLNNLTELSLQYALKSPDMDLYDFGFDSQHEAICNNVQNGRCVFTLHATCGIKVIWQNGIHRADKYDAYTQHTVFQDNIKSLIGLPIKRVALSDKNDLWLDIGDYWVVFVTFEDGEESWRLFSSDDEAPHLVATNLTLAFDDSVTIEVM